MCVCVASEGNRSELRGDSTGEKYSSISLVVCIYHSALSRRYFGDVDGSGGRWKIRDFRTNERGLFAAGWRFQAFLTSPDCPGLSFVSYMVRAWAYIYFFAEAGYERAVGGR